MRLLLSAALAMMLLTGPALALDQFGSEQSAQRHCPNDTVVWLNLPTMIWHYKGERWYGRTKRGAYVFTRPGAGDL